MLILNATFGKLKSNSSVVVNIVQFEDMIFLCS